MREQPDARAADVVAVETLSPSIVRVVVDVPGFASLGVSDEGCVLTFPVEGSSVAESDVERGHWYTVRRADGDRVTFDVIVHEGGAASEWARRGKPGDQLCLTYQNSWFTRPDGVDWQVLLVDTTGLPAAGRIVEEAPAGLRTIVVAEVPGPADEQELPGAEVRWVYNVELVHGGSELERIAREVRLPDGPGYVYVAGEAAATRAVRKYLRHELKLPAESYGVIGYWRRDAAAWAERVARSTVDLGELWQRAEAEATDEQEALDLYEERLGRAGLL
ncbi:siderophore-interacting protein [Pseudonocardia sulfidoxydans NBRC 16205]|uniref:Siderophore-interacting protein n=1 Tax=Pseudonocardia sulfidoxydans NBRC 16205 TaxID=1223511 RepID=A0A511DRS2_9PSEU|nr:siderophore-interacting protein [Pseudonocardia sulfidoxydans]GEL26444.1 siderophore-interacting protein [Pseudonocardia sulfidoxydans NBRC 16205]